MYFSTGSQLSTALASLSASKVGQFLAFDALYYSNTYMLNGNTTALTPIEHFVQYGAAAMAKPNATFDPVYYKQHYADLAGTNFNSADLLYHFMQFGLDEGRLPNATLAAAFNSTAYLAAYPDVAAYVNANLAAFGGSASNGALAHYVKFGAAQGFTLPTTPAVVAATTFNMADSTVGGVKSMVLTGGQDVRIDMTNSLNQITGLDLDGNGKIANDGKENSLTVKPASGYVAVDAYTRLVNGVVNETDLTKVFLGDIAYDGTGFAGDGVATNGNIVLGGLGADTILGGTGNDFLAGGGVALSRAAGGTDSLVGGRNADFIFAELSLLTNTDGNKTFIDGGSTADNTSAANGQSAQDSDWLLVQASDDDEPVSITLTENDLLAPIGATIGGIVTRAGQTAALRDIENVDASGNTYGFLKNLSTAIGGAPTGATNPNNDGIGSSAQLRITGSLANNILIGGYDNDGIDGSTGDDLLMGGNLNKLIDPNLVGIVGNNDGRDEITGGAGLDNIAFEADGGIIEGGAAQNTATSGNQDDAEDDTLWLTANSLGAVKAADVAVAPVSASSLTTDNTLRFDLAVGKFGGLDNAAGYGGADKAAATGNITADQTNYNAASVGLRVQLQDMESIIATGLGGVDYLAAGTNDFKTNLTFANEQNFLGYGGNMTLRGTGGGNTLYASKGADTVEGRTGNDMLSGGDGKDDFVFQTAGQSGTAGGDGIDVIHRQNDVNNDNIWDGTGSNRVVGTTVDAGTFGQDFGVNGSSIFGPSTLSVDFAGSNLLDANVWMGSFSVKIGTTTFAVTDLAGLKAITTVADLATFVNAAFQAIDPKVSVAATGTVLTITDATTTATSGGRVFSTTQAAGYDVNLQVQAPGAGALTVPVYTAAGATPSEDRLIFAAYEDRLDGELVDDNGMVNHTADATTLGRDGYAEDLVVRFNATGTNTQGSSTIGDTILAEDQTWTSTFTNLANEDTVSLSVNGTAFSLQMGVATNGTAITETAAQFIARLSSFINSIADGNTLAGSLVAANTVGTTVLTLTQGNGAGAGGGAGQNVFMDRPVITLGNASGGEPATVAITKTGTNTEITIADFDGRDGKLTAANALFVGGSAMDNGAIIGNGLNNENANGVANATSRSVLATAATTGSTIYGANALVLDSMTDTDLIAVDFSLHGDDYLIGGAGNDTLMGGTGDDRFQGSASSATVADVVNGGKDLYVVQTMVNGAIVKAVETMNTYQAGVRADITIAANANVLSVAYLAEDLVTGAADGFTDSLVFNQNDFTSPATTNFYITVGRVGDATRLLQTAGGEGTVQVGTFNSTTSVFTQTQGSTAFAEMEAIRTLAGDGTRAGQGRDTLDVSLISGDVAGSFATAVAANAVAAGVTVNLMSNTSAIRVRADLNANDADNLASETIANFLAVAGVENVIGGNANDIVNIDESEVRKDNTFTGGTETAVLSATVAGVAGDVMVYDHSDMDNSGVADTNAVPLRLALNNAKALPITTVLQFNAAGVALAAAGALTSTAGIVDTVTGAVDQLAAYNALVTQVAAAVAKDAQAYDMRPSVSLKIGATTDLVTMSGGTMLSDSPVDTLNGVEGVTLGFLAQSAMADTLDTTAIAGATVNFQLGKVFTGTAAAPVVGNLLIDIGNMTELENTNLAVTSADTVLFADTMTNANAVTYSTDSAAAGTPDFNNSFAFFRGAVNKVAVANQGLYTIDFGTGTGASVADTVDYKNETNQDINVVVDLTGAGVDRVVVAQAGVGIDGALTDFTVRVDVLKGADIYYAGGTDARWSGIDLSQHTGDLLTVQFSNNATALNTAAGAGEDIRNIQIVDGSTSVVKQFIDNGLTTVDRAAVLAGTATADALGNYWNRIEGNDKNETINLTDRESDHAIMLNLFGGNNTISYNDDSIGNTLFLNSVLTGAKQNLTVNLTTSFAADGTHTHTITGNVGSQRVDGSKTGNDVLNMAGVVGAYAIKLNNVEGSGWKGSVNQYQVDGNSDGLYTTGGVDSIAVSTTVSGYENITGNNANNSYEANTFVNAITAGSGNDAFTITTFTDVSGDTWLAGTGTDTLIINVAGAAASTAAFTLGNGALALDQSGTMAGVNSDFEQFENIDASGSTTTTYTLVGRTVFASVLRGGSGNDTITVSTANSVMDGGAGADGINFGAGAERAVYEAGDSDSASKDTVTGFLSGTDSIAVRVDMAARGLTNVTTGFATGATPVANSGTVKAFYDTTASTLLVDMDANGSFSLSGDLTIGGTGAVVAADVQFDILGTTGNNTITGAGEVDRIRGGQGVDTITGGDKAAVGEVHSYVLGGGGLAAGGTLILDGVTVTQGAVVAGTTVALADADAVGDAFVRLWATTPAAFANNGNLTSVSYNALTNSLDFNFKPTVVVVPAAAIGAATGTGAVTIGSPAEVVSTAFAAAVGSADVFVVVGSVDATQAQVYSGKYASQEAVNADLGGANLVNLTTDLLTVHATSDAATGDSINGNLGVDTLHIYGDANLSGTTLTSIEAIVAHSTVRMTVAQVNALSAAGTSISFDNEGVGTLVITGATATSNIDLSGLALNAGTDKIVLDGLSTFTGTVSYTAGAGYNPATELFLGSSATAFAIPAAQSLQVTTYAGAAALAAGTYSITDLPANELATTRLNGAVNVKTITTTATNVETIVILGATNTGSTTIHAATATGAQAALLSVGTNESITALTVTDAVLPADAVAIQSLITASKVGTVAFTTVAAGGVNLTGLTAATVVTDGGDSGANAVNLGAGAATYKFAATAAANGTDTITGFTSGTDKLNLDAVTASIFAKPTGATVAFTAAADNVLYFKSAVAGDADGAAAAVAFMNANSVYTDTAATFYVVIADNNSTAVYQVLGNATADEFTGDTLTLMGTVDAVVLTTDLLFA